MQSQLQPVYVPTDLRMPVDKLALGMFVSELDRPWSDTPFLLHGLLLETEAELGTIRRLCREITVDLSRSVGVDHLAPEGKTAGPSVGRRQVTSIRAELPVEGGDRQFDTMTGGMDVQGAPPEADRKQSWILACREGFQWSIEVLRELRQSDLRPPSTCSDGVDTHVVRREEASRGPVTRRGTTPGPAFSRNGDDDRRPEAAPEPGTGTRLCVLRWRALLKLIGLERADSDIASAVVVPTPDSGMDGAPPGKDLTAMDYAEAAQHVQQFEAELPRAARMLRQSMPVVLEAYSSAENGQPLEIETLDPVVNAIVDGVLRNQDALLWLARLQSHDQTTHARGLQAAVYMAQFGFHLGLPRADLESLALGGALLDIGKTQVPKEILHKPGPLDEDELGQARSHVEIAMRLLDASGVVASQVREMVERHHEREDGSGYPGRMSGDAIGLYGRMAGIVDTFLALSEARPYAPALPMDDCLSVLLRARGTLFHAPLVEHFIQMIGLYPVGSLVELSTGEVAAVLSHNRVRRLKPRVLVMIGADGKPLSRPMALDLLHQVPDGEGKEIRIMRGLPPGSYGIKAADMFAATVPE
jgi:HD-GYP domain-containing protein (c-di-GMP phosphodiesterase class II)